MATTDIPGLSGMSEGQRSGVPASEIADTIDAVFAYFQATKKDHPTLLQAIEKEASGWRGQVAGLRNADQALVDSFFGQPSSKDIEAVLAARGITEETTPQRQYNALFSDAAFERKTDPSAYWPGKVVPTLSDYRSILRFDAYRERLDGTGGIAH